MPLLGIEQHREAIAALVRQERRIYGGPGSAYSFDDVDVSIYDGISAFATPVDKKEHRAAACDARAEMWRRKRGTSTEPHLQIDLDDELQVFEEWSHTE